METIVNQGSKSLKDSAVKWKPRSILSKYLSFISWHPVFFLTPYVVIYVIFWAFKFPAQSLLQIFHVLNAFHIAFLLFKFYQARWSPVLWGAFILFTIFAFTGCYIEYPSDTWSHYDRIIRWSRFEEVHLSSSEIGKKMYYLWQWSFLSWFSLLQRREVLDLLNAFSQVLLGVEVFRISQKLKLNGFWKIVFGLLFLSTYGYSIFGARYFGISTTNIAYAAYLYLLGECLEFKKLEMKHSFGFSFILLFLYFNHVPEFVFSGVAIALSCLFLLLSRKWSNDKINLAFLGFILCVLSLNLFVDKDYIAPLPLGASFIVGILYLLAPMAAILSYRRQPPLFFCLTLLPFGVIFNVWVAEMAGSRLTHPIDILRFYWILVPCFVWCLFLKAIDDKIEDVSFKRLFRGSFLIAIVAIGFSPEHPWRGKLWFQFHKGVIERELRGTDYLADWFQKNRSYRLDRIFLTDDLTLFALGAHLGWEPLHSRVYPKDLPSLFDNEESIHKWIDSKQPQFAVLTIHEKLDDTRDSEVGKILHWPLSYGNLKLAMDASVKERVSRVLDKRGWSSISIPPYYIFREPPVSP